MLSAAKHLGAHREMLSVAKHDILCFGRQESSSAVGAIMHIGY